MEIKKSVDGLLNKQMDRKEFLATVGGAGLAAIGVTEVVKSLANQPPHGKSAGGYGGTVYGGDRKLGRINRKLS